MTSIDTEPGFDTLAYTQRLKAAGVEDKQAEAHAAAARDSQAGLATKADLDTGLAAVRAEIRGDLYRVVGADWRHCRGRRRHRQTAVARRRAVPAPAPRSESVNSPRRLPPSA